MSHIHHIIPKYRCKEMGIDPDFDDNLVSVTRDQHSLIHWGYKCKPQTIVRGMQSTTICNRYDTTRR